MQNNEVLTKRHSGLTPVSDTPADVVRRTQEAIDLWRPVIASSGYSAN